MGVRLSEDEAWAELAGAHTGIFTSLRRDGWPVSLPTWFVVLERSIYMRTPDRAKKLERVRHDRRSCFLVERGEQWAELAAVQVYVMASTVDDQELETRVVAALGAKYRDFRTPSPQMPDATKAHYGSGSTVIRLDPCGEVITWDNSRLRLGES